MKPSSTRAAMPSLTANRPPSPPGDRAGRLRPIALLSILGLSLVLGCSPKTSDPAVVRDDVETFLATYLPLLAEAYEKSDASLLEGYAVTKEIASIDKIIRDLAAQGKAIRPSLKSFTVEAVSSASYSIVLVTVVEIWDLRSFVLGSDAQLHEILDQRKRVKYQIRREKDSWAVSFRHVIEHDLG
jgi:hypothetical protein